MSLFSHFHTQKKVLIIEDDVLLRSTMRDQFTEAGFAVVDIGDAREVLVLLEEQHPHAVVLDLILPYKDGISILEEVRAAGHTLPVFLLTNLLGSSSLRDDAKRLDAVFYNKSSTALHELVTAVQQALSV